MNELNEDVLLKIKDLNKSYKNILANNGICLDITKGEIFGLLGPNGAGKTTLIRQIVGLLKPDSGSITLLGYDVVGNTKLLPQYISYLSQVLYAHKALKVEEFIRYTGIYRGLTNKDAINQTKDLIEYFHIKELKDRLIEFLSGGELQVVGFLGSIIGYRPLIILDEPTNDMDPEKRILLWKLVKELREKKKITFILVTHNVHEAQDVVDRVAIIQKGSIITQGKPIELIKKNATETKIFFEIPYDLEIDDTFRFLRKTRKLSQESYLLEIREDELNEVLYSLVTSKIGKQIRNIHIKRPSLEDAYLKEVELKRTYEHY